MSINILVSGFVQGVGFRKFVRREALKIDLTGWAQNLKNGRVEILVHGKKENLEKLLAKVKKGVFLSIIKKVEVKWDFKEDTNDVSGKNFIIKKV